MAALPAAGRVVIASKNPVKVNAVRHAFQAALPQLQLEFAGVASASGVPDQPWGDAETLTGALNRVAGLQHKYPNAILVALEGGVGPAFSVPHPLTPARAQQPLPENLPSNVAAGRAACGAAAAAAVQPAALPSRPQPGGSESSSSSGGGSSSLADKDFDQLECFAWAVVRTPAGGVSRARSASFTLPPRVAELMHQGMELGAADDEVFQRTKSGQGTGTIGRLTQVGGRPLVTRQAYYEHAVLMSLVPLMNSELYPGFELPGLGCQPGGSQPGSVGT